MLFRKMHFRKMQVELPAEAAYFRLEPGARLRPHSGPANFRLYCHLGLRVEAGGRALLRVGDEQRPWREGETLCFFELRVRTDFFVTLFFVTFRKSFSEKFNNFRGYISGNLRISLRDFDFSAKNTEIPGLMFSAKTADMPG